MKTLELTKQIVYKYVTGTIALAALLAAMLGTPSPTYADTGHFLQGDGVYFNNPTGVDKWEIQLWKSDNFGLTWWAKWNPRTNSPFNSTDPFDFYDVTSAQPNGMGYGIFKVMAHSYHNGRWSQWIMCNVSRFYGATTKFYFGWYIDWTAPSSQIRWVLADCTMAK